MKYLVSTFIVTLLISGCSLHKTSSEKIKKDDVKQPIMIKGMVTLTSQSQNIQICGSDKQYWLNVSAKQWEASKVITAQTEDPIYGELVGHFEKPPVGGLASHYPARFVVSHINQLSVNEKINCQQSHPSTTSIFASSNKEKTQPWLLQVSDKAMILNTKNKKNAQYIITDHDVTSNKQSYIANDLTFNMERKFCYSNNRKSLYGWSSEIIIKNEHHQGCALLSPKDTTAKWAGHYQNIKQPNNLSIHLNLQADHSATTTYQNKHSTEKVVETGVWQKLNNNQIHVLMSRYQDQYMISERIFTDEEEAIHTSKEKVNGIEYPLQNELILYPTKN